MKNLLKTVVILLLLINSSCKTPQIVQTSNDAYKLKENEQQFLNKPLKNLLKEIKLEIKIAYGKLDYPSYFAFRFVSKEEIQRRNFDETHLGLYIFVKEPITEWSNGKRPKEIEYQWTKEDLKKYGDFTVIEIKVIGKD